MHARGNPVQEGGLTINFPLGGKFPLGSFSMNANVKCASLENVENYLKGQNSYLTAPADVKMRSYQEVTTTPQSQNNRNMGARQERLGP